MRYNFYPAKKYLKSSFIAKLFVKTSGKQVLFNQRGKINFIDWIFVIIKSIERAAQNV